MNKKIFSIIICLVLILFSAKFLMAQIECGYSIYPLIETPSPYPKGEPYAPVVWSKIISEPGATWLKIHFSLFELNDEDYVDLIDKDGNLKERIKGIDVRNDKTSRFKVIENPGRTVNFWAHTIDGDTIIVELHSISRKSRGWGFIIDEIGVGTLPPEVVILSECGSGWLNTQCYAGTLEHISSTAVGRLHWQEGNKRWYWATGFLISCTGTNHFLTNEHCIDSQEDLNTLEVRFLHKTEECEGSEPLWIWLEVGGDQIITSNPDYDFTLLTLKYNPGLYLLGYLTPLDREPIQNESIYIVQHPYGGTQKIAEGVVNNVTVPTPIPPFFLLIDFDYYVDTAGGSSGSPVLSSSGVHHVIGIHHWGGPCPNEGVKMSEIYPFIKNYIGCSEPPDAPSSLDAEAIEGNIELWWHDNSDNEIEFRIERTTSPPNFSEIAIVDKNETYYKDITVVADITYYYRVSAYNPEGHSYSNTASAKIPPAVPEAPSYLDAEYNEDSQAVELTWGDSSNNEQGFAIERKSEWDPFWEEIARVGPNEAYYEDFNVEGDTIYYYRVRAYNQAGYSPYSDVADVYVPWYLIYIAVRAENTNQKLLIQKNKLFKLSQLKT